MQNSQEPTIEPISLSVDTPHNPSNIISHATVDVPSLVDLLAHAIVLEQGALPKTATRGTTLFTWEVSPGALQSQTQKSILRHLSECFSQWSGTIIFDLITTIPIYIQTKIVLAFAPLEVDVQQMDPASLAGLHNSVICNASNAYAVSLSVPFVSGMNWLSCKKPTGHLVAKLLDPIVTTMDVNTSLPWTLKCRADPRDFRFRYIIPPPLPPTGSSPSSSEPTLSDQITAASMSTTKRSRGQGATRGDDSFALVRQGVASTHITYKTMMLIPRTRVEFVMQKVRDQFPTNIAGQSVAGAIANMFDLPAYTLSSYNRFEVPNPYVIYPYLQNGYLVNFLNSSETPSLSYYPCYVVLKADGTINTIWLRVDGEQASALPDDPKSLALFAYISPSPAAQSQNKVFFHESSFCQLEKVEVIEGVSYHVWKNRDSHQDIEPQFQKHVAWVRVGLMSIRSDAGRTPSVICDMLRQIDQAPAEVTHLALYTDMEPELSQSFCKWLTTADNTPPPTEALSHFISFSPNQADLAYNERRLVPVEQSARGIVWRLFKLFKGNENAWWAWLVKALDVVVDALIGAFLGRSDAPYVVPITRGSGFRVEAVGAYDAELVRSFTQSLAQLEYIPPSPTTSLYHALTAPSESQHLPEAVPSSSFRPQSKSPFRHRSRFSSAAYQARHPSQKKHRFFNR